MKTKTLGIAVASCWLATAANAVPIHLDFTSNTWSTAEGSTSAAQSYGGLVVTLSATGGSLTFNSYEAPTPSAYTSSLALAGDGIGIGDDEVGDGESLMVSFSSAVTLLSFELLDLYQNEGPGGSAEGFMADFSPGGTKVDHAQATDGAGYYGSGSLGLLGIESILFTGITSWSDFALAGLWIDDGNLESPTSVPATRIPEPGSLALLGLGLLLLGAPRPRWASMGAKRLR